MRCGAALRWLVAAGLLAGCTPDPAPGSSRAAIIGGSVDDGDPAAVALVAASEIYCSGALVSDRVVVTAAHCIDEVLPKRVLFGASTDDANAIEIEVSARIQHRDFDPTSLAHDLGAVVLASPAPAGATPWPLWTDAMDDSFVGRPIRLIGFGATDNPDNTGGTKHHGTSTISAVGDRTFEFGPTPAQTCRGDSGGPALWSDGDREYLVGITSTGDALCAVSATDHRVDVYADFITAVIDGDCDNGASCPPESDGCSSTRDHTTPALVFAALVFALIGRRRRSLAPDRARSHRRR